MADPAKAFQLVNDDSQASRGLNYNELDTLAEERERVLFDTNLEVGGRAPYWAKGKGRSEDGEDDDEDDMAWEPAPTAEQAQRRRASGEAQYQPPGSTTPQQHHGHRRGSRMDRGPSSLDARRIRMLWWRSAGINVLFILAWYTFSTVISVYNKWMFSEDHYNFPYPLFVTSCHMLVQWTLSAVTLGIFKQLRSPHKPHPRDYGTKVLPCGVATGLDIGLSNLSLRSITLSFYTMCKSSSLAFVLMFAFLFKLETPSWRLVGIILIITSGVVLMVSTETQFDLAGMIEVLSASALGGLRWSLTQILLDKESMGMSNPIATLFWLAPIMGATLASCSIIFDGWGNVFSNEEFFGSFSRSIQTFSAILFPGVIAFLMNVTEFGLIQRTSVVTLSVAGIFKEVAVIFLSMFIFHDQLTPINVSGLCVTIFGIACYNYLKYKQFTDDPSAAKGHGHGARRREASVGGHATGGQDGFHEVSGQESYDEDAPMLSPRARNAARALGSTDDSAIFLDDMSSSAPLHSLGDDDDDDDRSSSSSATPRRGPSPPLHIASPSQKAQQHSHDAIPDFDARLHSGAEADRLVDLELRGERVEQGLDKAMRDHKEANVDEWDLLGEVEGDQEEAVRKKQA